MIKVAHTELFPIQFVFSDTEADFETYKFFDKDGNVFVLPKLDKQQVGCAFFAFRGRVSCVCICLNKSDMDNTSVWVHESFHAAQMTLEYLHIPFVPFASNEIYAYTVQYIFRCVEEFVMLVKAPADRAESLKNEHPDWLLLEDLDAGQLPLSKD
ncbi:MAG: hypothetical protein MJZ34_02625 [Paludibacteraceae bacterium]|nr:hypothetical protein [Paludibacteraceae bacterium]